VQIALVSREFYPYAGGGIAPIVAAAARFLSEIAEVTVFTSADHREEHARLRAQGDPRLVPDNVELVWVQEPQPGELGAYLSFMHHYSARVHQALRAHYGSRGPDLIEFCDYLGEGFVTVQAKHTLAGWLERTLVCVRLHTTAEMVSVLDGYVGSDLDTVATYEAERYVLRHADRVLWSGGDVYDSYLRFYRGAVAPGECIPDAFLPEGTVEPGPGLVAHDGDPLRLLYLGRMERRKGVQNLLRAVTALGRDDWSLTLLGGDTTSGPGGIALRAQLELMAAQDPRINLSEPVPRHEVEQYVKRSHALVVPSLWECWPNTAREALMHNRPLIATPVGGLTAMARPGRSGVLAADASAPALLDAFERVLDARERELGTMIVDEGPRAVFRELTDRDALVERYRKLVGGGVRRPRPRATKPLVTVVIPYFRLEALVEETLRTVLAQTYAPIETLLVVDGSLREQDAPAFELAERLGIGIVTQVNSGLGAARNFGVEQARGVYVLPLDADDYIDPTFVERCVDVLERDPSLAYVTTWVQYMKPDGTPLVNEDGGYMPFGNWSTMIDRNNVAGTCTSLFRRSVFDAGHDYSNDLTSFEDWLHYAHLHDAGLHGAVIPERLFHYRVRDDSMMRSIGAPSMERIAGEVDARRREREMRWTAAPVR